MQRLLLLLLLIRTGTSGSISGHTGGRMLAGLLLHELVLVSIVTMLAGHHVRMLAAVVRMVVMVVAQVMGVMVVGLLGVGGMNLAVWIGRN